MWGSKRKGGKKIGDIEDVKYLVFLSKQFAPQSLTSS